MPFPRIAQRSLVLVHKGAEHQCKAAYGKPDEVLCFCGKKLMSHCHVLSEPE